MRRLIDLRVFPDFWVLAPPAKERLVRLSYPFNDGIQSVLVAQSSSFYPVQLSGIRAFAIKAEQDVFQLPPPLFGGDCSLALKAIPSDFRSATAWCRVLIEVADLPPATSDDTEITQNLLLAQQGAALTSLTATVEGLVNPAPPVWSTADLGSRWTNFGQDHPPAGFCRTGATVALRGAIVWGGVNEIFQLPADCRPGFKVRFPVCSSSFTAGYKAGTVQVYPDGWVSYLDGYGDFVSLDSVRFEL